jgi:hypothetical protein
MMINIGIIGGSGYTAGIENLMFHLMQSLILFIAPQMLENRYQLRITRFDGRYRDEFDKVNPNVNVTFVCITVKSDSILKRKSICIY